MSALPRSVEPLALLALQQAAADGCAVYQLDAETGVRILHFAAGVPVPESGTGAFTVSSFPLRVDETLAAILVLVFRGRTIAPRASATVEQIARAIQDVWRLSLRSGIYARNAARIGALEAELADAKIADRARGLLSAGTAPANAIDTILGHVESVLRPSDLANTLARFERELAQEIAERQVTSQAKAVLQSRYGISEEQAHVHLRLVSRTTRRKLLEVAQALIENPVLFAPHRISAEPFPMKARDVTVAPGK
jgi:hypothetical protein